MAQSTLLYSKEGTSITALSPATTASQVLLNNESGSASNVETEIEALRTKIAAGAFMKSTDTADSIKDGTTKVVMTAEERTKLSNITAGAEANQNAFSKVKVGDTTVSSSAKEDTLELSAGEGVTLTPDTTNKKVTIAETYVDCCVVSSLDDVPSNLRNGGLVILKTA